MVGDEMFLVGDAVLRLRNRRNQSDKVLKYRDHIELKSPLTKICSRAMSFFPLTVRWGSVGATLFAGL
jgi:hypothetical protein